MADPVKPTAQEEFSQFRRYVEPMAVCWACHYHVYEGTVTCPHCGANVPQHAAKRDAQLAELVRLKEELEQILARVAPETDDGEAAPAPPPRKAPARKAAARKAAPRKAPPRKAAKPSKKAASQKATPRRAAKKPARKATRSRRR